MTVKSLLRYLNRRGITEDQFDHVNIVFDGGDFGNVTAITAANISSRPDDITLYLSAKRLMTDDELDNLPLGVN